MKAIRMSEEEYLALAQRRRDAEWLAGLPKQPKATKSAKKPVFVAPAVLISGLPPCVAEYRFAPPRKWRFDYAWTGQMVALEVEGGVWTQGRHTRGAGFLGDMEKYNRAAVLGWRIVRCTPDQLKSGAILPTVLDALRR